MNLTATSSLRSSLWGAGWKRRCDVNEVSEHGRHQEPMTPWKTGPCCERSGMEEHRTMRRSGRNEAETNIMGRLQLQWTFGAAHAARGGALVSVTKWKWWCDARFINSKEILFVMTEQIEKYLSSEILRILLYFSKWLRYRTGHKESEPQPGCQ